MQTLSLVGSVLGILKHLAVLNRFVDISGTVSIKDTTVKIMYSATLIGGVE